MSARAHGALVAAEVAELVGVSGTTVGQWARRGYIRSSRSSGEPRVYAVEDVAEAAIVAELLERGVRHAEVRAAIDHLHDAGDWPLSAAELATTEEGHVVLRRRDGAYVLTARGWQQLAVEPTLRDVRLRLPRSGDG